MTKEQKAVAIQELTDLLNGNHIIYLADIDGLNSANTSALRRECYKKGVKLQVVKNTLLKKAMESSERDFEEMYDVLKGNTSVMVAEGASTPAKLIKEFRKKSEKPIIKAAYVEESIYIGDKVDELANIKSKDELLGDVIGLLQSPIKNVVSALKSSSQTIAGVVKALEDRAES